MKPLHDTFIVFFFNDTATTEIYTLSLHDALPIWARQDWRAMSAWEQALGGSGIEVVAKATRRRFTVEYKRSEEHTSELQSRLHLVCRLLLEKKKKECQLLICEINRYRLT